jgi:hypothetical protein
MLKYLDAYTLRARLLPAILGAAPALAALLLLISWKSFELSTGVSILAALALVFALSDWARRAGKRIEPQIYTEMGGKPSVTMMYRADATIDEPSKNRYRTFLAGKVNKPEPTPQVEAASRQQRTRSMSSPAPGFARTRVTPNVFQSCSTSSLPMVSAAICSASSPPHSRSTGWWY